MTIDAIQLHNFRGFKEAQIELPGLTVLLGPNSAGKSSFAHAATALSYAQRVHPHAGLTLTPAAGEARNWPVDLGTLNDLRTQNATGPVKIGLRTGEGWVELGFGLDGFPSLMLSSVEYPRAPQTSATGESKVISEQPGGISVTSEPGAKVSLAGAEARLLIRRLNEQEWRENDEFVRPTFEGARLAILKHAGGTDVLLNQPAADEVQSFLETLTYLRATRKRPQRAYERSSTSQSVGYGGEFTADVLFSRRDVDVFWAAAPPIPRSSDEATALLNQGWTRTHAKLPLAVAGWMDWMELANQVQASEIEKSPDLRLTVGLHAEHALRSLTEVGFGLSQVLPIVVAGLLQPEGSLLMVDLPEAHLHPRPQALLGDFFCALAMSGRRVLIETHSEMLFHRLRLRSEMHAGLADRIAVYFADQPGADGLCIHPRRVGLSFNDELKWPAGFLGEALEAETAVRTVRQSKKAAPKK